MQIIKRIRIRYFRSIYSVSLDKCAELNVISGRNDSGKSNILRALNLFFNNETDWQSALRFYHDFSVHRLDEVRKESIKGRQFISVEIEFFRPPSYSGSLPPTFSVTRTWRRDSQQYHESSNIEALARAEKLPSSLGTARRGLQTFLNKIYYEYVPAIKDRVYSQYLLSRLQKELLDATLDDNTGIPRLAGNLAKTIQKQVVELQRDFHAATGLATAFEPPKQLSELFQAFNVATANNTDDTIPLSSRGDGIQARYLSSVLHYIAQKSGKFFIWGFEEPENSLEFRYAEELAQDFLNRYSKTSQIFITTHSPAFVALNEESTTCFRAFQEAQKTVVVNLNSAKTDVGHKRELEHELGILEIQRKVHALYASQIKEFKLVEQARAEAERELDNFKKSLLLVEGKTDKKIIETAWRKLYGVAMPFRIRVADPTINGSAGGTGMLAKTIEGVHPDDGRCCVALFDADTEGLKAFGMLSKNFSDYLNAPGIKVHSNNLSYAMLLPAPEFRQNYVKVENHMIEFMFDDDVLIKRIGTVGLQFKNPKTNMTLNGVHVDAAEFLQSNVTEKFLPYRKIHTGKDDFAEKIVPSLGRSDFKGFEILFDKLAVQFRAIIFLAVAGLCSVQKLCWAT